MPAVASLAAAGDLAGLERVKYDGPRFLVGLLTPATILAWIYAGPFLNLWVGPQFEVDAPLLRLFLVATIPLVLSVQIQMAIGLGRIKVIALSALIGAVVNLPLSYFLTRQPSIGVAGVIWGTVLTTLVSNLLIPGIYVFKELKIDLATFFRRTLSAPACGAACLAAASLALSFVYNVGPGPGEGRTWARVQPLTVHLAIGAAAYVVGYAIAPTGRADLRSLAARFLRSRRPSAA
jgi:O-antigen/teichoic acid export membrane protein